MCISEKPEEDAVSPVVGVMLMLVVTIIIAAVVSAYSGGITKGEEKPPTASIELHIVNDGTWGELLRSDCIEYQRANPDEES